MEPIQFKINAYKKYGVQIVRYIDTYNDEDGEPFTVHYDLSSIQYLRSDDLESFTEICKQLFEEFQIVEFKDVENTWPDKAVYTTPLLAQVIELDKVIKEKRNKSLDEQKIKNREWLATVPRCQLLYQFSSGTRPYLLLVHNIYHNNRNNREEVNSELYLSPLLEIPEDYREWNQTVDGNIQPIVLRLYRYLSKDNKVMRKKFHKDMNWQGYKAAELDLVVDRIVDYRKQIDQLHSLHI